MKSLNIFNNILIIRTDRLGDVVLTTPSIKALKSAYPTSRISILVTPATFDLVNGNPYLDEILIDDRLQKHKGLFGFMRLVKEISQKKYDLVIIFHTKRRYNLASFMARIPSRLGYRNNKFGFLLNLPLKDPRSLGIRHEAQYCLEVLKAIGIENNDLDLFVPLQKNAEDWLSQWMVENNLKSNQYITIHPGSSDPAKCWPSADFALLIDRLINQFDIKIVLIGSKETSKIAQEIINQTHHASVILDMTNKTSIAQMASLLRRTRLLISNDSGPVHVGAGVGISVISLFLRDQPGINPERWKPLGQRSYMMSNVPIPFKVDQVLELVDQILQKDNQYEIF